MLTLFGCLGDDESPKDGPLTEEQKKLLEKYEQEIATHQEAIAQALYLIHLLRLYRETHNDFDAYLAARWPHIHRSTAYRKINLAAVNSVLAEQAPDLPKPNQGAAQLLHKVSDVASVWKECVDRGLTTVEGVGQVIAEQEKPIGVKAAGEVKPVKISNRIELHVPEQFEDLVQEQFGLVVKPQQGRNVFRRSVKADEAADLVIEIGECLRDNHINPFSLNVSI